ncbi:MtN3 and saliva related transmembrane protein [Andreprevotia lacus DSM 23236]|jgi:MtN3 and saliva related transmembrane protein|uniref:MtN3 and saliva related transmembrane protein n=1 Tax=Andreprevotia lacus DSM 23236 TaxID=1121001 RepID=A0A1W1XLL5_9NEIS|nr:SemiSWEET transporter [Andreprevotia lacus]SMC24826.1 MtN3 and saliva related transmembrane protein [Andreprevotia lacus DSM 23236]
MNLVDLLGLMAGACTTAAFVPQVIMVWRTRSAKDISLGMYCLFVSGVFMWLVYGILANAMPVIVANAITLVLAASVLVMKLRFDRIAAEVELEMHKLTAKVADSFETDRAP